MTGAARRYAVALTERARATVADLGGADAIAAAWGGLAMEVHILCTFATAKAERWGTYHTHKPDKDNVEKMVLDCLAKAGALGGDDARVAGGGPVKLWGQVGSMAVTVRPLATRPAAGVIPLVKPSWL